MNIKDLKNIQSDLQCTADDLELVSLNLSGHLLYLQHSINTRDATDVVSQINKLQATAEDLRDVAQRIDC